MIKDFFKKLPIILILLMVIGLSVKATTTWYFWRFQTHATDATAITTGYLHDIAIQTNLYSLWYCDNATTGASTAANWHKITGTINQDCKKLVINGLNGGTFVVTYDILQVGNCSLASGNFTVDVDGGTGVLKLDTGTYATNTWYNIFIICKENGGVPSAFISLSATAPTMPADYLYKRRVGSIWATSTSAYRKFYTARYGEVIYENQAVALSAGTATTFTAVDCTTILPPTSVLAHAEIHPYATSGYSILSIRATGTTAFYRLFVTNAIDTQVYSIIPMNTSQSFDYFTDAAGGRAVHIAIIGYLDNL